MRSGVWDHAFQRVSSSKRFQRARVDVSALWPTAHSSSAQHHLWQNLKGWRVPRKRRCLLSVYGPPITPLPLPEPSLRSVEYERLVESGMWPCFIVTLHSVSIYVHNLYLPTRAKQDIATMEITNNLLRAVALVSSSH